MAAAWVGGAWVLTLGCLGCAILDSYTSLCVVGGTLGHIGSQAACPDFDGWDTRVFPLAVDMGWGGALFAVLRLARSIGFGNWRWWAVLVFDVLTAAFTIAGNAFHGAVLDGATTRIPGAWMVAISSVASAVPGVVAVGSGFTLSVLVSTRRPSRADPLAGADEGLAAIALEADRVRAGGRNPIPRVAARAEVRRLLSRYGDALTVERVVSRTGISLSRARTLLREERAAANAGRLPQPLDSVGGEVAR